MAPEIDRNLTIASVTPLRAAFAGDRKILSPFDKRECISLKTAATIAGKSESPCADGVKSTALAGVSAEGLGWLAVSA